MSRTTQQAPKTRSGTVASATSPPLAEPFKKLTVNEWDYMVNTISTLTKGLQELNETKKKDEEEKTEMKTAIIDLKDRVGDLTIMTEFIKLINGYDYIIKCISHIKEKNKKHTEITIKCINLKIDCLYLGRKIDIVIDTIYMIKNLENVLTEKQLAKLYTLIN